MKNADLKFCKKVAKRFIERTEMLSPVKIGFTLGVIANMPLIAVLTLLGGVGA